MEKLEVLFPPFLICVILTGIHGYLGIHVLARHVIFVDLAMAQVAALGTTLAFVLGYDPGSAQAYSLSLGFSLAHAAILALTRNRRERVPQEATIGLVYAIATALAVLAADLTPHGTEHLKAILSGSIVWVTWPQIGSTAAIYAAVGLFHFVYRERFLLISTNPEAAYAKGWNVRLWDFYFYLTFGIIITSSVQIAGVLLVFCYLIAPAVCAVQFADSLGARLAIGWVFGILVSAVGLFFSYDRPSGPTIICFFGLFLALAAAFQFIRNAPQRTKALRQVGVGTAAIVLAGWGIWHWMPRDAHSHGEPEHALGISDADLLHALADEHDNVRAEACERIGERGLREGAAPLRRRLREDASEHVQEKAALALAALGAREAIDDLSWLAQEKSRDEWVRFHAAEALAQLGSAACFPVLFELAFAAEASVLREDASKAIFRIVGENPAKHRGARRLPALQEIRARSLVAPQEIRFDPVSKTFDLPSIPGSPTSPK